MHEVLSSIPSTCIKWKWWPTPVILLFRRLRQVNQKVKVTLSYVASLTLALAIGNCFSKINKEKNNKPT